MEVEVLEHEDVGVLELDGVGLGKRSMSTTDSASEVCDALSRSQLVRSSVNSH